MLNQVHFPHKKVFFIVAILPRKDAQGILKTLNPLATHFFFTPIPGESAVSPIDLQALLPAHPAPSTCCDSPADALTQAKAAADDSSIIVVTGSLYLMRDFKQ